MRPKTLLILFAIVIIILIIFSVFFYLKFRKEAERGAKLIAWDQKSSTRIIQKVKNLKIKLLFTSEQQPLLYLEEREIMTGENIEDQCYDTIQELIKGPLSKNLIPTLPQEGEINSLFITPDGTAFVDLSKEIIKEQSGGTEEELLAIYSIVNTIILNFPSIKKVQILIDDRQQETFNGHIYIGIPLTLNKRLMGTENI